MSDFLVRLKDQAQQLLALASYIPNLPLALDLQLTSSFPRLPADSCTDFIYINYADIPEAGQTPPIISQTLSDLIEQCYITQHVPTYVQGEVYVYDDQYTLDAQDQNRFISIPALEEFLKYINQNLDLSVKSSLEHFWNTPLPELDNLTPRLRLSQYAKSVLDAEMQIRHADKTLSDAGKAAVAHILDVPHAQTQTESSWSIYCLGFKGEIAALDIPLNGPFVITRKTAIADARDTFQLAAKPVHTSQDNSVVLYLPGSGLEEFESLHALTLELIKRLNDGLQREALLNYVLAKDREQAECQAHPGFREITTPVFDDYADKLISKQLHDIGHVWKVARREGKQHSLEYLAEEMDRVINASITLNPAAIVQTRYTLLLESHLPYWLKSAPQTEKIQWRLAVERLRHEVTASQAPGITHTHDSGNKSSLLDFARVKLKQQIKADHGIDIDPDTISIATTEALSTGSVIYPLASSGFAAGINIHRTGPTITYRTTTRSLSELSLQNVGIWDVTFALTAQVNGPDGNRHPVLTHTYVKNLVRMLNIGEAYKTHLNQLLVTSEQAEWRKERYCALKHAQLTVDLQEATMASNIDAEEASWVKAVLNQPLQERRPAVNGATINVQLLMLRYKPLPGLLVFTSSKSSRLLCYTPGAPDNIWLRGANSLNDLCRILSDKTLHTYVLQRVTPAKQAYIKPLLEEGLTGSNTQLQNIHANYLQASYDTEVLYAIRNADEQSTSTFESNVQTAKDTVLTLVDVVCFVLPFKVLVPLVMVRFLYSIGQGIDALQRDEKHEALLHFMGSISHLTDGASDFAGSKVFASAIRHRIKTPSPSLNPNAASPRTVAGMRLRTGGHYGGGVYELTDLGGGPAVHYLKDNQGRLYRSHYDNLNETWRVLDARKLDAQFTLPVRELSAGLWDADPAAAWTNPKAGVQVLIEKAQVSGVDLAQKTPEPSGIYKINDLEYIEQNGVVFEVRSGWLGRHLYLQLPGTSSSSKSTFKVRRHAGESYWEVKGKDPEGQKHWEPLMLDASTVNPLEPSAHFSNYDVAPEHIWDTNELIKRGGGALDPQRMYFSQTPTNPARNSFFALRHKLLSDAQEFFKTTASKPRVRIPEIAPNASHQVLLQKLYEQTPGVIIGEAHSNTSAKKFLIDNMPYLSRQNIKTLYLEHLQTDFHQALIDDFFKTGKMPIQLDTFLNNQDKGHRVNRTTPYTYRNLVSEARKHGVKIKAIDCAASYHIEGMPTTYANTTRHEMMNYFATLIIRGHKVKIGDHKWIALTGNTHANTFRGVPGLAELEGAIGLRLEDAVPGTGRGVKTDPGFVSYNPMRTYDHSFLKNDLVLDIEIPETKPRAAPLSPQELEARLLQPGSYYFENELSAGPMIIHRSSNQELMQTLIKTDPDGKLFIERPRWALVHQKRYAQLNELIRDLSHMGMNYVH